MYAILRKFRILLTRTFIPKASYFLFRSPTRSLKPLSDHFGYDRGTPVDRYYIEEFLEQNSRMITGICLEIHDTAYIQKFGQGVVQADALDVDSRNKQAKIIANLKHMSQLSDNTYDCLVVTHTLGMIDDFQAAIRECYRILKPGGAMLVTLAAFNKVEYPDSNFWRFTTASAKYAFGQVFNPAQVTVASYGNVFAGQAFWVGAAQEDLTSRELAYNDPAYPIVISVVAQK